MHRFLLLTALAACTTSTTSDDKGDTGPDGVVGDTDVVEEDTGLDTAPATDTSIDDDTATDTGGDTDTGGPAPMVEIEVQLTADDAWQLWIDGVPHTAPNQTGWQYDDTVKVTVPGRRHVVAIAAADQSRVIAGLLAVVRVSTEVYSVTGDGKWKMSSTAPPPDWTEVAFPDGAWPAAYRCPTSESDVWGTYWQQDLLKQGAAWIWPRSCRELGDGWFRLNIAP